MPEIHRIDASPRALADAVAAAVAALAAGRLIGLPTETVYGLAADARNANAVAAIYRAKGRPSRNPLIVHVADIEAAARIAVLSETALAVAEALWPGPLTLVAPLRPGAGLAPAVTAGLDTVAVRVPARPVAHAILAGFGAPVAAPSANRSGRVTATTAAHVVADLGDDVAVVIDDGPSPAGIESTILDVTGLDVTGLDVTGLDVTGLGVTGAPRILREGAVPAELISAILGMAVEGGASGAESGAGVTDGAIRAPGMLASHYAPGSELRLNATGVRPGEALLAFGANAVRNAGAAAAVRNLSPSGDLAEAAHNLFAMLRELDGTAPVIAVAPVPEAGLGAALNDRLRRAAAPRS